MAAGGREEGPAPADSRGRQRASARRRCSSRRRFGVESHRHLAHAGEARRGGRARPRRAGARRRPARVRGEVARRIDVCLDLVGGSYFAETLAAMAPRGTIMLVGLTAGATADVPLCHVLGKRLRVIGTTLRARDDKERTALTAPLRARRRAAVQEEEAQGGGERREADDRGDAARSRRWRATRPSERRC